MAFWNDGHTFEGIQKNTKKTFGWFNEKKKLKPPALPIWKMTINHTSWNWLLRNMGSSKQISFVYKSDRGPQTFSLKGQSVHTSGSASHVVGHTTTQLCHHGMEKAATDKMQITGWLCSNKILLMKSGSSGPHFADSWIRWTRWESIGSGVCGGGRGGGDKEDHDGQCRWAWEAPAPLLQLCGVASCVCQRPTCEHP